MQRGQGTSAMRHSKRQPPPEDVPRYTSNTMPAEKLFEEALKLEPDERARLAKAIIASVEDEAAGGLDSAWLAEIERRAEDIDHGKATFVSWDEARKEIEDSLRSER